MPAPSGEGMLAAGQTAHHLESLRIIAMLCVIALLAFWRIVIRVIVITLVAAVLILIVLGVFVALEGIQR
jgi:hypothetical protein